MQFLRIQPWIFVALLGCFVFSGQLGCSKKKPRRTNVILSPDEQIDRILQYLKNELKPIPITGGSSSMVVRDEITGGIDEMTRETDRMQAIIQIETTTSVLAAIDMKPPENKKPQTGKHELDQLDRFVDSSDPLAMDKNSINHPTFDPVGKNTGARGDDEPRSATAHTEGSETTTILLVRDKGSWVQSGQIADEYLQEKLLKALSFQNEKYIR